MHSASFDRENVQQKVQPLNRQRYIFEQTVQATLLSQREICLQDTLHSTYYKVPKLMFLMDDTSKISQCHFLK